MEKLQKKIHSYINTAMGYSVILIILGLVLLFFPSLSLDFIRWGLAFVLIVAGLGMLINDLRRQTVFSMFSGSILGVLLLVMGVIVVTHPDVMAIIPIVLGGWMIVSSAFTMRLTATLKGSNASGFWGALITSIISIICGAILIFHPISGAVAITSIIGGVIVVYAIAGLIDIAIFRRNMDEVASYIKKSVKVIDGKEIK